MFGAICRAEARRALAVGAGLATIGFGLASLTSSEAAAQPPHEITVTVSKFTPLDRADDLSDGDFFARLTIDGQAVVSPTLSAKGAEKPGWKLTKSVPPGVHKVKLELIDKDVSVDDPIDINKVDKKRDLDFAIDTKSCRIEGFSETYKCGATITRSGGEAKKATIEFTVAVKK
ncbi:hypothetical protein [Hyphomicrobium sp.]|uniref:hypothetical protein n=1 Tax=Hyphomicrobium sp. TaxID=82 RepID=UPI002E34D5E2|nr:hypothetical protein [Hyphomicrobium sp.]HEX2843343.1 hypothetical protein [Hyphomicrobium sp.]